MSLILSLFPGIGLLDAAFEAEGFCVVRGPDLLWGGDIKRFHPPAGRFDGIIGGPPCQAFSTMTALVRHNGFDVSEDLIPEYERVVAEAGPAWFLMENVKHAPVAKVCGYKVHAPLFNNRWIGGEQSRLHRFSFGTRDGRRLETAPEEVALENPCYSPRVMASGSAWVPVRLGGSGKQKRTFKGRKLGRIYGDHSNAYFRDAVRLQGLPDYFDLPGFTVREKIRALGNAVPYPMGRALARSVRRALGLPIVTVAA